MSEDVFTDMLEDKPEQNWHCRICGAPHIGTHDLPLGELCEGCSDQPATTPSATPITDAAVTNSLGRADRLNADEWQVVFGKLAGHMRTLERELADARRERDNALSDWRRADTDSIRAIHERNEAREAFSAQVEAWNEVREQRDHLTATLREIILADSLDDARAIAREALAATKP
jgi:hypothetical protein